MSKQMQEEAIGRNNYRLLKKYYNEEGMYELRTYDTPCKYLWLYLKPISLQIEGKSFTIQPSGYTYQLNDENSCAIGIQTSPYQ